MNGHVKLHSERRRTLRMRRGQTASGRADDAVSLSDLSSRDGGTRVRAAQTLQARLGNAALEQLVARDDSGSGGGSLPLTGGSATTSGTTFTRTDSEEKRDDETLNDIATELSNRGEAGSTQPAFGTISTSLDGNGKVTSATLTVTETVTMPTWTKLDKQCDPIKTEWNRFHAALATHEQGHVDIDKKWFANIDKKLVGLKDEDVDAKVEEIKKKADKDNEDYDTTTQHGITQGTKIDAGIRCSDKVD